MVTDRKRKIIDGRRWLIADRWLIAGGRRWFIVNPRRACAARVTVVVLCVCVCVCVCLCVHGSNLLVAQLRDKLVILTGCSLQN